MRGRHLLPELARVAALAVADGSDDDAKAAVRHPPVVAAAVDAAVEVDAAGLMEAHTARAGSLRSIRNRHCRVRSGAGADTLRGRGNGICRRRRPSRPAIQREGFLIEVVGRPLLEAKAVEPRILGA